MRQSVEGERSHLVVFLPALQLFPLGGQHLVGVNRTRRQQQREEEALQLVVRDEGGKCEWRAPNMILVVQLGTNEDEAKVFRAHAVPQGLC